MLKVHRAKCSKRPSNDIAVSGCVERFNTPSDAPLSKLARQELKEILVHEVGPALLENLTDEDIDHIGVFLLTVHAEAAKHKVIKSL
ncbi:MAG: hypothetical protein UW55_C0010G0014 [Candidatus Giovannonibacteria bacterium GW2011_GWA2_44_26]|uniref:Uncharacterized protein n=1 Tax=Candidatus Giovannonibacteria bacterium GW2011_GWA2_44_26 TaxID=1618648 RepID=A0A0G1IU97_9BACT|nr:MAG: hypothetical protein UW55_C0010G0014 [Candidatus Giovannonibacteria bacterium GW2011_GWA2_44_26]